MAKFQIHSVVNTQWKITPTHKNNIHLTEYFESDKNKNDLSLSVCLPSAPSEINSDYTNGTSGSLKMKMKRQKQKRKKETANSRRWHIRTKVCIFFLHYVVEFVKTISYFFVSFERFVIYTCIEMNSSLNFNVEHLRWFIETIKEIVGSNWCAIFFVFFTIF